MVLKVFEQMEAELAAQASLALADKQAVEVPATVDTETAVEFTAAV